MLYLIFFDRFVCAKFPLLKQLYLIILLALLTHLWWTIF